VLISGHFSPARVVPVLLAGCSDSFTSRTMNEGGTKAVANLSHLQTATDCSRNLYIPPP